MKKLLSTIKPLRETGCLMTLLPNGLIDILSDNEHIFDRVDLETTGNAGGFESDPHVTILYGIETVDKAEVIRVIQGYLSKSLHKQFDLKIDKDPSTFINDEFTVIKYGVTSTIISELHEYLKANLTHLPSKFEGFNAHITVAYVKTGTHLKYMSKLAELPDNCLIDIDLVMSLKGSVQDTPYIHLSI